MGLGVLVLHRIGTVATAIALAGAGLPLAAGATAQEPLLRTDSGTESRYVVLFEPTTAHTEAAEEIDDQCGAMGRYHPEVGVAVADSAEEAFERASDSSGAFSAERELSGAGEQAHGLPDESKSRSARERSRDRVRATRARALTRGEDVVAAVLDSGLDQHHLRAGGAVDEALVEDCVAPGSRPAKAAPGSSHGAPVAGLITAADDGRGVTGIAPGARLARSGGDGEGHVHPEYAACRFMRAVSVGARVANSSSLVEAASGAARAEVDPGCRAKRSGALSSTPSPAVS